MKTEKVAIITGANRGIGKEVARNFAQDGYNLILISRKKDQLIEFQNELKKYPVQTELIIGDITQSDLMSEQLEQVLKKWGRCDVLVNNAGIFIYGTLETTLEDYKKLFETNFKAQLVLIKIIIPYMKKQGHGYVFNIASLAGKIGYANLGAYTSSKFALVGLTESLHAEYSSQGIKFTAICPGFVATDMANGAPIPENEMINTKDIYTIMKGLLLLSPHAFVKEIIINTAEKTYFKIDLEVQKKCYEKGLPRC
ncbi:MAG TPA: SDR family oxidoreductase [Gammaproteobacteria bacterium]|nr:SDR family oxidoreductase [Gammaproteobacteria bacterium]